MSYVSPGTSPGSHNKAHAGQRARRIASRMTQAMRGASPALAGGAECHSLSLPTLPLPMIATTHGGFRRARSVRAALPFAPHSNSTPFAGEA